MSEKDNKIAVSNVCEAEILPKFPIGASLIIAYVENSDKMVWPIWTRVVLGVIESFSVSNMALVPRKCHYLYSWWANSD